MNCTLQRISDERPLMIDKGRAARTGLSPALAQLW